MVLLIRRATAARWTEVNPVLERGRLGGEIDTGNLKVGNGTSRWSELPYVGESFADAPHTHVLTDVAGLVEALAGKSDLGHTHSAADLTDFEDAVLDISGGLSVLDLYRKFLLLLKHFVVLGLPPPPGLEDDLEPALTME